MTQQPSTQNRRRESGQPQAELLQAVLDRAKIREWDLLLIGDGSGNSWQLPCGWASTLIDRSTRDRHVFFGAASAGSINLAEMMPYFQALMWFHQRTGRQRIKQQGALDVHIITDSTTTVTHGTQAAVPGKGLPNVPQRPLWAAMREFGHMGYNIQWHWAERSTSSLNFLSDLIAALARKQLLLLGQDVSLPDKGELARRAQEALADVRFVDPLDGAQLDVYTLNP